MKDHVGVAGLGIYVPDNYMTAKEISEATGGVWEEWAVKEKLGVNKKNLYLGQMMEQKKWVIELLRI